MAIGFKVNTVLMQFQVPDKKAAKPNTISDSAIQDVLQQFSQVILQILSTLRLGQLLDYSLDKCTLALPQISFGFYIAYFT